MKPAVSLIGPSGVGKTSYAIRLVEEYGFAQSPVYVTRPARNDDRCHVRHVSVEEFGHRHAKGDFLECDQYNGHWYGTGWRQFHELIASDTTNGVVLDLTPSGCRQAKRSIPWLTVIALVPNEVAWLERRLRLRATDSNVVIQQRIAGLNEYLASLDGLSEITVTCYEQPSSWDRTFSAIVRHLQQG